MTDAPLQHLPRDSFLARLDSLMDESVLADVDRIDLRLRLLVDQFLSLADVTSADLAEMEAALLSAFAKASQEAVDVTAMRVVASSRTSDAMLAAILARGGDAARAALRVGRDLDRALLCDIAARGDVAEAAAVAGRPDLTREVATILFRRPESEVLVALLRNPGCHRDRATASWLVTRARRDDALAQALLARAPIACDLTPLYLAADAAGRKKLLGEARRLDVGNLPMPRRIASATLVATLEKALADRERTAAIDALARDQRIPRQDIERIVADAEGEPLALLLNVAGVPATLAMRLLSWIVSIPLEGPALVSLSRLCSELPPRTARRVIAAITGRPPLSDDATKRGPLTAGAEPIPAWQSAPSQAFRRRR